MESRKPRARISFRLAIIISLALHGVILFVHLSSPEMTPRTGVSTTESRFDATLAPRTPQPQVIPPPQQEKSKVGKTPKKKATTPVLTAKRGAVGQRNWSVAERNDMDKFLKDLDAETRPTKGTDMARRAMALARQMGREPGPDSEDFRPAKGGKPIDSFSLDMYFDAFVRKLNRSAAFVKRENRGNGTRVAQVLITLNADGSLQSYKVLRAADQQAEIAFIRSVVERASPFSAFPPDIKSATGTLTIMMCISPTGGGDGFTRISGGECRG